MKLKILWMISIVVIMAAFLAAPVCLQAQKEIPAPTKLAFYINIINSYPNQINAGQDNHFYMEVRNDSNVPLSNIQFKTDAPSGWVIEFQPASLDTLAAGGYATVDINIVPDHSNSRNNTITFIAQANETQAITNMYVTVEGGVSYWLWIGIGITVVVLAAFIVIFLRQNRQ